MEESYLDMNSMKNWMLQIYYPPSYQKYDVKRLIYVTTIKNGNNRKQYGTKYWHLIVCSFYWSNKLFNKEQHGNSLEVPIEGLWTSSQLHKGWNPSTGTTIIKVKPAKKNGNNLTHNKCQNGEYQKQPLETFYWEIFWSSSLQRTLLWTWIISNPLVKNMEYRKSDLVYESLDLGKNKETGPKSIGRL